MKMTYRVKSNGSSVPKSYNQFNVKREPTLNIERNNTCMKWGHTFSKVHLAVCSAKKRSCTFCKHRGNFTRLSKFCRKTVIIGDTQNKDNTDINYSSHQLDLNNDRVNRECCGVINTWSESGKSDNVDFSVLNLTTKERFWRWRYFSVLNLTTKERFWRWM